MNLSAGRGRPDPTRCFVCGGAKHADTPAHDYWSEADAMAEARAHDARTTVRYSDGSTTAEAAYVNQHRPY
jgi:hypothetical protein